MPCQEVQKTVKLAGRVAAGRVKKSNCVRERDAKRVYDRE